MTTLSGTAQLPAAESAELTGADLDLTALVAVVLAGRPVRVSESAWVRLEEAHQVLRRARLSGRVYGANTGVGANRQVSAVAADDAPEEAARKASAHAASLLRSHCAGVGPLEDEATSRAAMVIRLNQLLAGGSGVSGPLARGLFAAIEAGAMPSLHRYGAIGTADLAPLAELALTLIGERPWRSGGVAPVPLADTDALPMMSSSAVTLATAALATRTVTELMGAATAVAALSFLALDGSTEALDDAVHRGRPHPRQRAIAHSLAALVAHDRTTPSRRVQDPFGLRVLPQVHAPAAEALQRLVDVIEIEVNSAVENPLVTGDGVRHHGQFHLASLAAALDQARISVYPVFTLSAARLSALLTPDLTGLTAFLGDGTPGSSGLMITEYVVQDLLAQLRVAATPVSGASVNISLGVEEHASFATQGARLLQVFATVAPTIIAVEAVAAVRALRLAPERLGDSPARAIYDSLAGELDADLRDRPLGEQVERALQLLPSLGRFVSAGV